MMRCCPNLATGSAKRRRAAQAGFASVWALLCILVGAIVFPVLNKSGPQALADRPIKMRSVAPLNNFIEENESARLMFENSCLYTPDTHQCDGKSSDPNSGECGNRRAVCIQPPQNTVKPANKHGRYDWLLGLGIVLSPFIAGYCAYKAVRDI